MTDDERKGRPLILPSASIVDARGQAITREQTLERLEDIKPTTIAGIPRKSITCIMCDEHVMHGAIEGPEEKIKVMFGAQKIDGIWWVPVKGHLGVLCSYPSAATKDFWHDDTLRAAYYADRRLRAKKRRERRSKMRRQ